MSEPAPLNERGWPVDPTENYEGDIVAKLYAAWGRIRAGKPAAYDGPDIGWQEACTCLGKSALEPESLKRMRDDNGVSYTESVLYLTFQLGIEYGRRKHRVEIEGTLLRLARAAQQAGADLGWLKDRFAKETGAPLPAAPADAHAECRSERRSWAELVKALMLAAKHPGHKANEGIRWARSAMRSHGVDLDALLASVYAPCQAEVTGEKK